MANKVAKVEIYIDTPENVGTMDSTEYTFEAYDAQGEIIPEYLGGNVALIAIDLANAILNGLYAQQQGLKYGKEANTDQDVESEGMES